jgi:hypothetical protein
MIIQVISVDSLGQVISGYVRLDQVRAEYVRLYEITSC